ncbi:exodeoxyribonuclease V subunit beta [Pseudoduganella umbonata]|uniref:RecBCD enzyme subunit RecB n=1 Tax=Pseudoduganella umbonata TaxID=864828 RepID=A0A4P8HQK0_9BURK|nr:exodeoxyribonuclease V subunit beta [Pseudoduganella umbonata]MBB3221472.1 exodeoxyribonuclease V beta subunit [Pseudoduganella umbonata]QCP10625.1 exodeoxyribonuclease V subunit beta [Pseudoduganella umbonata]
MSRLLEPMTFPLHGTRLIEASAGTGKTWTIAALYLRLVLGHGGADAYGRPLLPADILVMTFTRAATRELSNRIRERLVEAAGCFRGQVEDCDPYLAGLLDAYPDQTQREQAAHRLMLAAETMDEAAIFTIDAWCQRMLREHAFDSGSLFDEELISDETALFEDAAHDYWRQQVYPLREPALGALLECWPDVGRLKRALRELVKRAGDDWHSGEPLGALIGRSLHERAREVAVLKEGWTDRLERMALWLERQRDAKLLDGRKLRADYVAGWLASLRTWALDPAQTIPALTDAGWHRLTPAGLAEAYKGTDCPDDFAALATLQQALAALEPLEHRLKRHAAGIVAARIAELKARDRQFGFADMLVRLQRALEGENGAALRQRITEQYPVALVDEFQDTAPSQYRIFDLLYRVADNDPACGLFLIGDPKQSIYGFRGADIHSYLAARRATEGRHYQLGTNYRSTRDVVEAVNRIFLHAEGTADGSGFAQGAFRFRRGTVNPLPFEAVDAKGRGERLVGTEGQLQALTVSCSEVPDLNADGYREFFAHHCAEHIVGLLNDPGAGFDGPQGFRRLEPADIAILVRDRNEAAAIRRALQRRRVPSVYLSDKDSVLESDEAKDVLRWLAALANPLDGALARAAFATRTANIPLAELARLSADELAWEARVEQLKNLHTVWQRQGVLAMLRRFIHELGLPAALLAPGNVGGERSLTNLLHLAELLQSASRQLDGEQALIRWMAEQVEGEGAAGDEQVLRLESDAELVKVVTVHKSKGLEYPLVYLPFAVTARKVDRRNRSFFEYTDADGVRRIDMALSDEAQEAVEAARIEEDLRLLYVALTRARHFLWLGVAALPAGKGGGNALHESALGYLLTGGDPVPADSLQERWRALAGDCGAIGIAALCHPERVTRLDRVERRPPLLEPRPYDARFERNWSVGSFTSLARGTQAAPRRAQEETLLEGEDTDVAAAARIDEAPWHRFPRGSVPGNFLHEQLEWLAQEGFDCVDDAACEVRLGRRIERAGWGHRLDDAVAWLRAAVTTPLPPLDAALRDIGAVLPEMEFWFPSEHLATGALDALCRRHLLDGIPRPALPQRGLHGMLKGFSDLVFEHAGRYWVLDYKSNALGGNDAAYHARALAQGMAEHRYDVQGAIYLLALHRLLASRLGEAYDPAEQLGGAVFFFLRGIGNAATRGCHVLAPDAQLLDELDELLRRGAEYGGNNDD